ncbi:hypothetical protein VTH06DRAFT_981 [Thermothelomyces fergusii]
MHFEFVDHGAIDGATRRRIRRRAAEGRNAGRKLSRPSRRTAFANRATARPFPVHARPPQSTVAPEPQPAAESDGGRIDATAVHPVSRPPVVDLGSPHPAVSRPPVVDLGSPHPAVNLLPTHLYRYAPGCEGSALVRSVVSFLIGIRHPPELDRALDYRSEPRAKWVEPIFSDEAYFHGAVAVFLSGKTCALPAPYHYRTAQDLSSTRTRHLCRALRLVNDRLSREDAASNENLTAVLILGLYERQQGDYHRGRVHLLGLERMVQLRGGLAALTRTTGGLARKIFRSDIECSLHLGTPTRFPLDLVEPLLSANALTPARTRAVSPSDLRHLLHDAAQLARLLTAAVVAAGTATIN